MKTFLAEMARIYIGLIELVYGKQEKVRVTLDKDWPFT